METKLITTEDFLSCDDHLAVLVSKAGTGKTAALLQDFTDRVGIGYGPDWHGLFLGGWNEVHHLLNFSDERGPQTCVKGGVQEGCTVIWPGGEKLTVAYIASQVDVWGFGGLAYPWIGWDDMHEVVEPEYRYRMQDICRKPYEASPVPARMRFTIREENIALPRSEWLNAKYGD